MTCHSVIAGEAEVIPSSGAGVTVTATSTALQGERTTITNTRGAYWLGTLPPGTYDVTFSKTGHTTITKRAVIELARVAHADAKLEPNEDEESVTSTALTVTVAENTDVASHITHEGLQRMPVESTPIGAASLFKRTPAELTSLDGVAVPDLASFGEEALDEVTIVHAGAGAEIDQTRGGLIVARTRSGSEERAITLRDSISNGGNHLFEGAYSGHLAPETLWIFADAWIGDDAFRHLEDARGVITKLTAELNAAHHLDASYVDLDDDTNIASVRYDAMFDASTTLQALAARGSRDDEETLSLRATHIIGNHVLSFGGTTWSDDHALFINDRWSAGRVTINAGLHHENDELDARAGIVFDLRGNGRQAIIANFGEYDDVQQATLGFASAIGTTGSARADVFRRDDGFTTSDEFRVAAQYRLFDRFEAGGTYSFVDDAFVRHQGTAWSGVELPIGDHEFGVTLLQRYDESRVERSNPTDLALRYTIPFAKFRVTVASDIGNIFETSRLPRTRRLWIRVRI